MKILCSVVGAVVGCVLYFVNDRIAIDTILLYIG